MFLEIAFILFHDVLEFLPKEFSNFFNYLNIVKYYKKYWDNNKNIIWKDFVDEYYSNRKISKIDEISFKYFLNEINFGKKFLSEFLIKRSIITLYNLQNTEKDIKNRNDFSDKKYMDYLEKIGSNQKIQLICIINEYKYYK